VALVALLATAYLLWRRRLLAIGQRPSLGEFHRVSLVATPLTLLATVTVLALTG
jgi:arsenical pump membrane protein